VLERDLQKGVVDVAKILGYLVQHTRVAWTGKGYRTPIQGHVGFPDLVIVGHGRCLFIELKVGRNTLSPEQTAWLEALRTAAQEAYVWTNRDWEDGIVEAVLRREPKVEAAA